MQTFTTDTNGATWFDQDDHGDNRRKRWTRRRRARQIAYIIAPGHKKDEENPLKRIKSCGRAKAPDVGIYAAPNGKAYASGLMACGNVWTCPTCAARIRARREIEIESALASHTASGGTIAMMTLTLRHTRSERLTDTLSNLNDSWAKLQRFSSYKPLYNALTGTIVTVEITHGENGWHPHLHILLLVGADVAPRTLSTAVTKLRWAWSQLVNAKHDAYSIEHGLNLIRFGTDSAAAARYVTKLAKEMTLNSSKSGNDPFSLLDNPDRRSTALYIEYAHATHGRQVHRWSNGLRRTLGATQEVTDQALAEQNEKVGIEILIITREYWNAASDKDRLAWLEFAEAQHHLSGP